MKYIVFILSFFILALAVMPCSDGMTCSEDKTEAAQTSHEHSHSEDKGDLCPPFCICACCGVASIIMPIVSLDFSYTIIHIEKKQSDYTSEYRSFSLNTIWQPPRV